MRVDREQIEEVVREGFGGGDAQVDAAGDVAGLLKENGIGGGEGADIDGEALEGEEGKGEDKIGRNGSERKE